MISTTVAASETRPARSITPARSSSGGSTDRGEAHPPAVSRRAATTRLGRNASDDDILGLGAAGNRISGQGVENDLDAQLAFDFDEEPPLASDAETRRDPGQSRLRESANAQTEDLRAVLDANPSLRKDCEDATSYRESFATPEEARNATAMLSDLNRMDALFFSRRPEDHAELARSIASLDPAAFDSLARAMGAQASMTAEANGSIAAGARLSHSVTASQESVDRSLEANGSGPAKVERRAQHAVPLQPKTSVNSAGPTAAQTYFFHATNAATVETVLDAIETQVERLLPDGVSKNARNRVVGEIYRELDGTLRSNRQLAQQMRDAFRSGALDAEHQRAIVSMVAGRARQALPAVAKRILSEWTSTVVAANQDRRSRQRAAERRVDIAGSRGGGGEGHRATSPRDLDYARMSDADILNL
jgi:hypothetical protein